MYLREIQRPEKAGRLEETGEKTWFLDLDHGTPTVKEVHMM